MTGPRVQRLLGVVGDQPPGDLTTRVCGAATEVLHGVGVGLSLVTEQILTPVGATREARPSERLQADLGEGPGFDVGHTGQTVAVPDLARTSPWPVLGPAIVECGIRAVFGFPLASAGVDLGAMTVYRARPGELSDDEHADALVLATMSTDLLLGMQADRAHEDVPGTVDEPAAGEWVVHQACGMVAEQLRVTVGEALAGLRARAFATGQPLELVAGDVVARRLRLDGRS